MSGGVARVAFADALASGMEVMTAVVALIMLLVRRMLSSRDMQSEVVGLRV